jgi:hypothetical protein
MLECIRLHDILACAAVTVFILAGASAADKKAPTGVAASPVYERSGERWNLGVFDSARKLQKAP